MQITAQQIGGALGLAALAMLAVRVTSGEIADGASPRDAAMAGYALSFGIAAGVLVLCAVLVLAIMENIRPQPREAAAAESAQHVSPDEPASAN